jgi:hypothetical protein
LSVKKLLREVFARTQVSNRIELGLRYTNELEARMYDRERLSHGVARLDAAWMKRAD